MNSSIPRAQTRDLKLVPAWPTRLFPNHEWVLLLVLFFESLIFSITGDNFFTAANGFEITRLSVEIGLLALALTPVIISARVRVGRSQPVGVPILDLRSITRR